MSESIKNKAIRGVAWSAVEKFLRQGLMTLFSIIIARQLSPSDYGLVAMLTIFLIVAQVFVDSGFMEALIQKQDRTEVDFSTTFWFNIGTEIDSSVCRKIKQHLIIVEGILRVNELHTEIVLLDLLNAYLEGGVL